MWIFLFIRNKIIELLNALYTTVSKIDKPKLIKSVGKTAAWVVGTYALIFTLGGITTLIFSEVFKPIYPGEFFVSFFLVGLMIFLLLLMGLGGIACIIYVLVKISRPLFVAYKNTSNFIMHNYRIAKKGTKVSPVWKIKSGD